MIYVALYNQGTRLERARTSSLLKSEQAKSQNSMSESRNLVKYSQDLVHHYCLLELLR